MAHKSLRGDVLEPQGYVNPSLVDILLTDVSEADVRESIARYMNMNLGLQITYLGRVSDDIARSKPVLGVVFGNNHRLFVPLSVRRKQTDAYITVIFLVDTGCPHVYLSPNAIRAIIPNGEAVDTFRLDVHGAEIPVELSPPSGNFADLNVLGASFLAKVDAKLSIDYREGTLSINW